MMNVQFVLYFYYEQRVTLYLSPTAVSEWFDLDQLITCYSEVQHVDFRGQEQSVANFTVCWTGGTLLFVDFGEQTCTTLYKHKYHNNC